MRTDGTPYFLDVRHLCDGFGKLRTPPLLVLAVVLEVGAPKGSTVCGAAERRTLRLLLWPQIRVNGCAGLEMEQI